MKMKIQLTSSKKWGECPLKGVSSSSKLVNLLSLGQLIEKVIKTT